MMTAVKIPCPVCGKHNFSYANSFEICPICDWENEEYQMNHPNEDGGANGLSLNEYRQKWRSGMPGKKLVGVML